VQQEVLHRLSAKAKEKRFAVSSKYIEVAAEMWYNMIWGNPHIEKERSTMKKICLLDLNYTLVGNQQETLSIRPFGARLKAEEYRTDLIERIKDDYVIIITARPDYHMVETMENLYRKTGWKPQEWYFNDINARPPVFKESALRRFVFPKHGEAPEQYYAVESNPRTRAMYARHGICAAPYETFIKDGLVEVKKVPQETRAEQLAFC
jgi:hypothetical protein